MSQGCRKQNNHNFPIQQNYHFSVEGPLQSGFLWRVIKYCSPGGCPRPRATIIGHQARQCIRAAGILLEQNSIPKQNHHFPIHIARAISNSPFSKENRSHPYGSGSSRFGGFSQPFSKPTGIGLLHKSVTELGHHLWVSANYQQSIGLEELLRNRRRYFRQPEFPQRMITWNRLFP